MKTTSHDLRIALFDECGEGRQSMRGPDFDSHWNIRGQISGARWTGVAIDLEPHLHLVQPIMNKIGASKIAKDPGPPGCQ